jgi:hypothetical protein
LSEVARADSSAEAGARRAAILAIAAALILRALFLLQFRENPDTEAYRETASIAARGGLVWAETVRYNYSPVWAWTLKGLFHLSRATGAPLTALVLGLLLAGDLATAALLFAIGRRRLGMTSGRAAGAAALFLANPVSILASSFRGMFDNLAIVFLLLALYAVSAPKPRRLLATGWLSLSLLVKHIAWFHPLILTVRRRSDRIGFAALLSYAVFLASFLPYLAARPQIEQNVFRYRSMGEPWGTEFLRFVPGFPTWGTTVIFVVATVAAALLLSRVEILRASLLLFLTSLLFLPGITPYYLVWPIALGSLFAGAGYAAYTVVATGLFLASPDGLGLEFAHLPGWGGTWFAAAFWLLWEIRTGHGEAYPRLTP